MTIERDSATKNIAFIMETSFHYYVYSSILYFLIENRVNVDIIINDLIESDFVNDMLNELGRINNNKINYLLLSSVLKNGKKYDCLVSTYYIPYAESIAKKHVRAMYGLAKNEWNHANWNAKYDLILCYSSYSEEALKERSNVSVVGNPRFDKWHKKEFTVQLPDNIKLSPSKKTILYAPTYGDLSSIPHWAEKLSRLQYDFNIILKLHHGTIFRNTERKSLKICKRFFDNIIYNSDSTFTLLAASDYVISDNSGFIFDAINAKKRIILLNWDGMQSLLQKNKSYSTADSPEQKVRDYLPTAADILDIRKYLSNDEHWDNYESINSKLILKYCDAFNDGLAGQRAAKAILDLID